MTEKNAKLKVALVQSDLSWEDPRGNRRRFDEHMGRLNESVDLVVLPEMFTTGFSMETEKLAEEMSGETIQWMKSRAEEMKTALAGTLIVRENNNFFNRLVVVFKGGSQNI